MPIKEGDQFIFERMNPAMFFLRFNIAYCVFDARDGDAKGSVTFLPFKQALRESLMNPF